MTGEILEPNAVAVDYGGRWRIASAVPARRYAFHDESLATMGIGPDDLVWAEHHTTAFICPVGDEAKYVPLGKASAAGHGS